MFLVLADEFVTDAAHVDDADVGVTGEFVAKFGDEDVEAASVEERVVAPKFEEDVADGHHVTSVQTEAFQDFSLSMGKREDLRGEVSIGEEQLLGEGVELVVADDKQVLSIFGDRGLCDASTSDEGFEANHQFLHAKGFAKVVVGSEFKTMHHVFGGSTCGEEEDGNVWVVLTKTFHHVETIHAGHHHVGDKDVGMECVVHPQALFAVVSNVDGEALLVERVFDDEGEGGFILNQEYRYVFVRSHRNYRKEMSMPPMSHASRLSVWALGLGK